MTPCALFWHLIETKYSLTVNHEDLLTRHSIRCLFERRHHSELAWLIRLGHLNWWIVTISNNPRFSGNSQIPDPVDIFILFPITALYFGQIPNPENTLLDPDENTINVFLYLQR